jgi:arylsulfatase A-like enzyme
MSGGKSARWKDDQIAATLTSHATDFITNHRDRPFFLYFATHDIHVPRVPEARFVGSSQCGIRGDAIQELDWSVGQVMGTLEKLNLAGNTLVIFSSDNGPVVHDGYNDGSERNLNGHKPAGPFRGGKYSIYEGGTRVPLITNWPGHIKAGLASDALLCQTDFFASFASLLGKPVEKNGAPDSQNVLGALFGESQTGRKELIEESQGLALRHGNWKFIARGTPAGPKDGGAKTAEELYDLATDPGEKRNVAAEHPDIVKELAGELSGLSGR